MASAPIRRSVRITGCFSAHARGEKDQSDDWWIDTIDSTVEHPRGGLWIAEMERVPVGMLFARTDTDDTVVEIGAMWVRRQPVGRALAPVC